MTKIRRFTVYRPNMEGTAHTPEQKNAPDEPQFEGVIFTDGTVVLRWLTACRSVSVWNNLEDMLAVHGHPEYGTRIEWHDGDPNAPICLQCTPPCHCGE